MVRTNTDRCIPKHLGTGCLLTVLCLLGGRPAAGQGTASPGLQQRQLQLGLGAVPGIGLQTGYISLRNFYTVEGILYVYASPPFAGGEADLQFSLGLGSALRPLGVLRTIGNTGDTGYDLDVGLRIGPGLTFPVGHETIADKNKRFTLVFEPFVRFVTELERGRTLFAEAGGHRPFLRAGLWLSF